ncbi:GNAT family N-acetyltransferase [Undibacterium sp.]|uniref:GNAT family N-acetyltransferase n=1 Tax=Undibacterium sp. TaxID=1914977 RepID=UPI002C01C85B|nr:GNAT family N-acetyltransferase [Undibacterium sp.]HTD05750.1 GNAT family N-acetyltransferase [Undibacterium sp.]
MLDPLHVNDVKPRLANCTETERLVLRRPGLADIPRLFAICGDPQTNLYNPAGPYPDIQKAEAVMAAWISHWQHRGFGQWAIASKDDPAQILGFGGLAVLNYLDEPRINLGFRLATTAWGKGYAAEMAVKALELAFGHLRLSTVYAKVRPANLASISVLERIGMQRNGSIDDVPGQEQSFVYVMSKDYPRVQRG